jgi:hypothetical protein
VSPTRGAQGNALKTIMPMAYVLNEQHGEDASGRTIIEANGVAHHVLVRFDNWQLRRLGALKDAANVVSGLAICIDNVASVAYQASNLHKITHPVDGGESIERRQLSQLDTPTVQKCGGADNDSIRAIATHCLEGCINLGTSERPGIVMFDIRVDAGRHSPRRIPEPIIRSIPPE